MENYKMPNHEQWLDWLEKNHKDYYVDKDSGWVCKDIVIRGEAWSNIVLQFADNGEFYDIVLDD